MDCLIFSKQFVLKTYSYVPNGCNYELITNATLFSISLFVAQIIPGPEFAFRARARSADHARGAKSLWHLPGARAFADGRTAATRRLRH